jgi:hypothetical protein
VNEILNDGDIAESPHAQDKHPSLSLFDVIFGLKEDWKETEAQFDEEHNEWRYAIRTLGFNEKWLKIVFALDQQKREIQIVTRYQDEFDRSGKKIPEPSPQLPSVPQEKEGDN